MAALHKKTETTARLWFYLVDATDGLTAETGENGGACQVSKNGGAFGTTGLSTLTHIGNGHYYATLNLVTATAAAGDRFVGRYKSANTAEAPSLNVIHAVEFNPDSDIDNLIDRLGSITGSGSNTVLGFIQALARKDVSAPSDIAGNFAPSSDSLEAISDDQNETQGAGFNTSIHSLVALYNLLINSGQTSSVTSTLNSAGFLNRLIAAIRKMVDEPSINAKWSNSDILAKIRDAWAQMWLDVNLNSEVPITVRYDIAISSSTEDYKLPPNVGEIIRLSKINSTTGIPEWELDSASYRNPAGFGFRIEGNTLRVNPKWTTGYTMRLDYIPNGDISPIEGTVLGSAFTSTTVNLNSMSVTLGTLDTRENAYGGYYLRKVSEVDGGGTARTGFIMEEPLVASWENTTRVATFRTALDQTPISSNTVTVELVTVLGYNLERLLALTAARMILADEGRDKRMVSQTQHYKECLRNVRLALANMNSRNKSGMEGDTVDNNRYQTF